MSQSDSEYSDSDKDSLESIARFDGDIENVESSEDNTYIKNVRETVKNWKTKELNKNTQNNANPKGLNGLRVYVANASRLFYDLSNYLTTSKNKESNMKDSYYVKIISAIGNPGSLSEPLKSMLEHFLERDLVELPLTLEPNLSNAYAKNGVEMTRNFPEEE